MLDQKQSPEGAGVWMLANYFRFDARSIIFVSLALFDFYVRGFRIGEFLAYALTAYVVLGTTPRADNLFRLSFVVIGSGFYFIYGINQAANFDLLKSALGIFIVSLVLVVFLAYDIRVQSATIRLLIWVNIIFFLVQFISYYGTGYLINYHWWTDIEERLESGNIVRPAGLYYEPAIYGLALFMMTTMLDPRESRLNLTSVVAAATMILSLSLWSIGAGIFVLIRVAAHRPRAGLAGALCCLILLMAASQAQSIDVVEVLDAVGGRLSGLEADDSAFDRYAGLATLWEQSDTKLILGFGFGGPQDLYGGNAFGRLVSEIGLLGLAIFVMFLVYNADRPLDFALCFLLILAAAPIVTYGFFAFWLAARSCRTGPDRNGRRPTLEYASHG